jgi:hypothetical protein
MKNLAIIFLLLIIKESNCVDQQSTCKLNKNSPDQRCPNGFTFKCGTKFCSSNRTDCFKFILSGEFLIQMSNEKNVFKRNKDLSSSSSSSPRSNIKLCPKNWSVKDVCLNEKKCLYKPKIWSFADVPKIWIKCACEKSYNYKCGYAYCTKDKGACDGFDWKKFKGKIQRCK